MPSSFSQPRPERLDRVSPEDNVVIIGGGPAGLTAAYQLSKGNIPCMVLEKDQTVGGISRTANYKGFLFDIGGHRFFTKVKAVEDIWHEILSDQDFRVCARLSRIYYNRKFFPYPLDPIYTLQHLGIVKSLGILGSYLKSQCLPELPENNFERWVSNRFGKRLYRIFFEAYTEKVWGISPKEISSEWAEQRIKDLSIPTLLKNALFKVGSKNGSVIKTLLHEFHYPRLGPGMMWESAARLVAHKGGRVRLGANVEKIYWSKGRVDALEILVNGRRETTPAWQVISSMPLRELLQKFEPRVPSVYREAAERLRYRDFLTVALIINKPQVFPDNWIYIHDPEVKVGRIQNFKNWSAEMVPDQQKTCLGMEYFCFEGDGLWSANDSDLVELAKQELETMGLAKISDVEDGTVVRMPKAYPVYDQTYRDALGEIRQFLSGLHNLQVVGRNGMHKYNNQDHSMLTALLAVENIQGAHHDLWSVNVEQSYHEEGRSDSTQNEDVSALNSTQPQVPEPLDRKSSPS